jgi:CheY-like chemotaxis protein
MEGEVAAHSAPGVGSRFWLELPFDAAAAAVAPPRDRDGERALKVMIVDEDALGAAMLRASLESLGHRVLHAQDGARAIDLLNVGEVDLIMLDGRLAAPTAPETARRLRARATAGGPPLVAVIGGDAAEAQAMLEAGADAELRKPATVAAVARILADAQAKSPARAPSPAEAIGA